MKIAGWLTSACVAIALTTSGCASLQQQPKPADVRLANGCVIVAANKIAVLDAHDALNPTYWRRPILIRYQGRPDLGHCYCYWEIDGEAQAYDEGGDRWLTVPSHNAHTVGVQLAGDQLLSAEWLSRADLAAGVPNTTSDALP